MSTPTNPRSGSQIVGDLIEQIIAGKPHHDDIDGVLDLAPSRKDPARLRCPACGCDCIVWGPGAAAWCASCEQPWTRGGGAH